MAPKFGAICKGIFCCALFESTDKTHVDIFESIHVRKETIQSNSDIEKIFVKHGVDKNKFERAYNSFGINSQVNQAKSRIMVT